MANGCNSVASSENFETILSFLEVHSENNKTKIKWTGELDNLKKLIKDWLKLSGEWTFQLCNGGYHFFKSSCISINFYPGTKTLHIQGPKQDDIKKKLLSAAKSGTTPTEDALQDLNTSASSDELDEDDEILISRGSIPILNENHNTESQVRSSFNEISFEELRWASQSNSRQDSRLESLERRIAQLETSLNSTLQQENGELKKKLMLLEDENKNLKEENSALLISLRLICKENGKDLQQENNISKVEPLKNANAVDLQSQSQRKKDPNPKNKGNSQRHKEPVEPKNKGTHNNIPQHKDKLLIVGDCMVKNLQGHKMSKSSNVKVWSFPGCTVQDMEDHIKPLLRKNPEEIILHLGTNNLKDSDPKTCADKIAELCSQVNKSTKITISSIVGRADDHTLDTKGKQVNKILNEVCKKNKWNFVDHSNIDAEKHLNRSRLHLNKSGTKVFATNFINSFKKSK